MNPFEMLLQDELNRLIDRVAARAGAEGVAGLKADLKLRLDRSEERLTSLRSALLDGYAAWTRALGEYEDLWLLADLRRQIEAGPAEPAELRAA